MHIGISHRARPGCRRQARDLSAGQTGAPGDLRPERTADHVVQLTGADD